MLAKIKVDCNTDMWNVCGTENLMTAVKIHILKGIQIVLLFGLQLFPHAIGHAHNNNNNET